jgi:CRISPR-associated endonuclease Cas2
MKRKTKDSLKMFSVCLYDLLKIGTCVTVGSILSQGRATPKLLRGFIRFGASRLKQALREQKIGGFIEYDEEDERSRIILTEKGFVRSTKWTLQNIFNVKWDHFWRLILFDIPEKKRMRAKFRRLLKTIGCYRLQKSVYVYPHDCKKEILRLAASCRVSANVDIITVPNLGRHEKDARAFYFARHGNNY